MVSCYEIQLNSESAALHKSGISCEFKCVVRFFSMKIYVTLSYIERR